MLPHKCPISKAFKSHDFKAEQSEKESLNVLINKSASTVYAALSYALISVEGSCHTGLACTAYQMRSNQHHCEYQWFKCNSMPASSRKRSDDWLGCCRQPDAMLSCFAEVVDARWTCQLGVLQKLFETMIVQNAVGKKHAHLCLLHCQSEVGSQIIPH